MKFRTKCVHSQNRKYDSTGAVSTPIFQSATFAHRGGENTGFDYSRLQNPTREEVEIMIRNLENGSDALAFSTGMAAVAALMELFTPGSHIIACQDLYGGSIRLFDHISQKNGIQITYANLQNPALLEGLLQDNTRAVFMESPTNPLMNVLDVARISAIAKSHGCLSIVDNTFLTPYFFRPLELGADVVIHSGTKYLCGHNDTLAGFLVVKDSALAEKLRFIYKTTGACLSPFDSWLTIRGIKTLALRLEQQQANALKIAQWLQNHPQVVQVYYPGLPSHTGHALLLQQASGFGAMLSFRVKNAQLVDRILSRVSLITYAESLGGVETLITHPMRQTHADLPEQTRRTLGIDETLLRLSVGIEDTEDLLRELSQVLA